MGALIGSEIPEHDPWPCVEAWVACHTAEEFDARVDLLGLAGGIVRPGLPTGSPVPKSSPPFRSINGAFVIDFSALWAGPLCAHLLGLGGARIVKVETPSRPDGARQGNPGFYRLLHGGHESIVLDPSDSSERRALASLVGHADVIIEASRPRALRGFGLEAEEYVREGTVWVSITARGRHSNRIGFGDDIAAASGLVARADDGTPLFVGDAIADPLAGLAAAAAVLSTARGEGKLWDIAMSDVVGSTLSMPPTPGSRLDPDRAGSSRNRGIAPRSGQDTEAVLREFGIDGSERGC
jgi:crotonobetainyl-CoA:carnitine CoA-transferase CaiB-like acyl-CoA transferase